jgi:ribosomal protein S18 acetylase RimI-like enzyme
MTLAHSSIAIRQAELRDLAAVKQMADANTNSLGFVPRPALAAGIARGWLLVAECVTEGAGEIVGFVHYRHRQDLQTTLYEICVARYHRRRGIGIALVSALAAEAASLGKTHVRLKAPTEIAANNFYRAVGFSLIGTEPGRKRDLNIWAYAVPTKESVR